MTDNAGTLVYWQANTVSATGKILTETLGNGATTTRGYDTLDRMTSNVVAKTGVNLQNFTYTYDTIGNLTQRVDVVQVEPHRELPPGIERIAAHAAVGCVTTALGGGSCGAGALSAEVAKFAGGKLDGIGGLNDLGRGIAVTVIGGTAPVNQRREVREWRGDGGVWVSFQLFDSRPAHGGSHQ